jgi:hypothetical protein
MSSLFVCSGSCGFLDSFVPNWSSVELALDHDPRSAFLGDYVYTLVAAFSRNTRAPSRPVQFLGAEVFEFCWSHLAENSRDS